MEEGKREMKCHTVQTKVHSGLHVSARSTVKGEEDEAYETPLPLLLARGEESLPITHIDFPICEFLALKFANYVFSASAFVSCTKGIQEEAKGIECLILDRSTARPLFFLMFRSI